MIEWDLQIEKYKWCKLRRANYKDQKNREKAER
jgi:hypothetical protein